MMMMMMTMYHAWSINSFSSAASRAQAEAARDVDVAIDGRRIENSTQSQPGGYPFCECEHNFCTLVWVKYAVFFLFFQYFFVFSRAYTSFGLQHTARSVAFIGWSVFLAPFSFPSTRQSVLQVFSFLPPPSHRCRHLHLCSLSSSVQFLDWLQWWGCWVEAQRRRRWLGSRAC